MAKELTFRSTDTPWTPENKAEGLLFRVKCPAKGTTPNGMAEICLVKECRQCGFYVEEGWREQKGQGYIVCSYEE